MSFQMIHMEIAYRLLSRLPKIKNSAEFILGSVAPDAVHMNPNYDVSMKVQTHMFENCGKWSDTQNYNQWSDNIRRVFCKYCAEKEMGSQKDFILGLCVHCLTDYWNDIKIWKGLQHKYIPPMCFEEFRDAYYPEARGIDVWLYQNSKNTGTVREMLSGASAFDIENLASKADVEKQREHLLNVQYDVGVVDMSDYRFLSESFIEEFIDFVVNDIAETIEIWSENDFSVK